MQISVKVCCGAIICQQCDGILCSGPSPENMASTVVDCRKLSTDGKLAFFRIGVVPRSQVEAMFAKVMAYHSGSIPPSVRSKAGGPHENAGFEVDITSFLVPVQRCYTRLSFGKMINTILFNIHLAYVQHFLDKSVFFYFKLSLLKKKMVSKILMQSYKK